MADENRTVENSPQVYARIGGALYLAIIVLGAFAEGFVADKLLVTGDAAATAHNIMASPMLWHLSVAGDLIVAVCAVPLLWIEYLLLRPVNKQLVVLAVLFNLVSLAVESVSKLFLLVVMPTLGNGDYLKAFDPQQLQILANLALKSHDIAFNIALIFFGCTRIVLLPVASREGCECREVERAPQPSQRPKNLKVRSHACCDQTGSYWVAGIRCGPTAVSLAKA